MPVRGNEPKAKDAKKVFRALRALADRTGRPFTIETKDERLRIQKAVYLLNRAGYPAARQFGFSEYLNGPYSPDLTTEYYKVGDEEMLNYTSAGDLPPGFVETFAEADQKGILFLEALATILKLAEPDGRLGYGLEQARIIKPHIPESEWAEVRRFLEAHQELTRYT
jgi:uncharacterized protein YwgA